MNERTDLEREAGDQFLDWAFAERFGGDAPPDRAREITAQWREEAASPTADRSGEHRILAVIAALLAIASVVGISLGFGEEPAKGDGSASAQDRGDPEPVIVRRAEGIARLPATTRAVRCYRQSDEIVAALLRFKNLQTLELVNDWRLQTQNDARFPNRVEPPQERSSITDAAFANIGKMTKLRRLELSGSFSLTGSGLEHLRQLPVLESLTLRFADTLDKHFVHIGGLTALRHLDVSYNYGFNRIGMAALRKCRGLETLSLRGCPQIWPADLNAIAGLPKLRVLDVGRLDAEGWRLDGGMRSPRSAMLLSLSHDFADAGRHGVRNATLAALAGNPSLRVLRLGPVKPQFTLAGLRALGESSGLRELDLQGVEGITDEDVRAVLQIESLRKLSVRGCTKLSPAVLESFAAAKGLRELDLRDLVWMTEVEAKDLKRANPAIRVRLR